MSQLKQKTALSSNEIYGLRPIEFLLQTAPEKIRTILIDSNKTGTVKLAEVARQAGISVKVVSSDFFTKKFANQNHQSIVANIINSPPLGESEFIQKITRLKVKGELIRLLILDSIQDPHNLGAIIRTAEASGVNAILASARNSVGITDTVVKSSSGTALKMPFFTSNNIVRTIKNIQQIGVWVYVLSGEATTPINQEKWDGDIAVVVGSESKGCKQSIKKIADGVLSIPMMGAISSLNVSVATGVVLYHIMFTSKVG